MKIAFCLEKFNPARGGAEMYVADLSRRICARGHQVHIFTTMNAVFPFANLHIHLIRVPHRPRFFRTVAFALKINQKVKAGGFDVIHAFERTLGMNIIQPLGGSYVASLIGNLRSLNGGFSRAVKLLSYFFSFRRWAYFVLEKIQMKEADVVIAISAMVKNDLIRYNRVPADQIRIVRNGVDLDKFNPDNRKMYRDKVRLDLGVGVEEILILFVAHNFRLKGLSSLIKALEWLNRDQRKGKHRLAVLGNGKNKQFRAYSRKHNVADDVIFLGGRRRTEIFYAAADICVHPSFYDPSALVVLEAMASGLPVITTIFCGTSEIVEEGVNGFVVDDPNDTPIMVERIRQLSDPAVRENIGRRGRATAERFPYSRNQMEILNIYDEYIGSRA